MERLPKYLQLLKKKLIYTLLYWKLTYYIANTLEDKFPDSVKIVYLNKLKKKRANIIFFHESFELKDSFYKKNFFDYDSNKGSLCPDNKWKNLLDKDDITFIKKMTGEEIECKKKISVLLITCCANVLFFIARINPILSKIILDFLFFPLKMIRRFINAKFF